MFETVVCPHHFCHVCGCPRCCLSLPANPVIQIEDRYRALELLIPEGLRSKVSPAGAVSRGQSSGLTGRVLPSTSHGAGRTSCHSESCLKNVDHCSRPFPHLSLTSSPLSVFHHILHLGHFIPESPCRLMFIRLSVLVSIMKEIHIQ